MNSMWQAHYQFIEPCHIVDLEAAGLLPFQWVTAIRETIRVAGVERVLYGASVTVVQKTEAKYVLVDGTVIRQHLPWLVELYDHVFVDIASTLTGTKMCTDSNHRSAVNINFIVGGQHNYELHVDSNPLTGVLFASTLLENDGGALAFEYNGTTRRFQPSVGKLLFFDARDKPHAVDPIRLGVERISIPMNFFVEGELRQRPDDLDEYLYGQKGE